MKEKTIGILIFTGIIIALAFIFIWGYFIKLPIFCIFKSTLGLYCPMCGATRATIYLLNGDILSALRCNLVYIIFLIPNTYLLIISAICFLKGNATILFNRKFVIFYILIMIVCFIAFEIIRNINIYPFIYLKPIPYL